MAQHLNKIDLKKFASASSSAIEFSASTDSASAPRLRIEAGGKHTWSDGSVTGDTNLYRSAANTLKTDDYFIAEGGLTVESYQVTTVGASSGTVLKFDGTKFAPGVASTVGSINDLSDVVITAPEEFQVLEYNGTEWVNAHASSSVYVRNAESTTLTTGTVVYLFGATGDHATVKRADKTSDTTSSKTVGVVAANIAASQNGPVVTQGYVDGIDLSVGYTAGDVLWLNTNGTFTKTKPTAPDHLVFVGVVVRATNNGIIYVSAQNGYELDELHNVSLPSPQSGEFLKYNGSLWVADAIDLGTDTTGSYVASLVAGSGISLTNNSGEGATPTITNSGVLSINGNTGAITGVVTTGDTGTVTSTMILDGTIANADINASAAIALSKLASGTSAQIVLANGSGVPTYTSVTGDVTISNTGVTTIGSGVIVNADINASAAIALSKLASGTAGQFVLANASGVPTYTTLTGDISVTSAGVVTVKKAATVSDTPPGSPVTGQLWYESDTGATFIYYDASWVEVGGNAGGSNPAESDQFVLAMSVFS